MSDNLEPGSSLKTLRPDNIPIKIHYGTTSWSRAEWIGKIYPQGTREKDFLPCYARQYNAVELNATHYRSYTSAEIKAWTDKVEGENFLFCPKFPKSISHHSFFNNVEDETRSFLESISAFGDHLGPVFLQVSSKFSSKRKEGLYKYLQSLPRNLKLFLEVENPDWFEEGTYKEHLAFLRENAVGSIINDAPGRTVNKGLSVSKCFIKYTPADDLSEVKKWFEKIKEWEEEGLTHAYFFVQPGTQKDHQLQALEYFKQLVTGS